MKIKNFPNISISQYLNISRRRRGFTLMELLVGVGILGLVMLASTNLFFTSIKTKKKVKALTEVKQNGDYALQIMSSMIRNAKKINDDCSPIIELTSLNITNPDGGTTTFLFNTQAASNAAALTTAGLTLSNGSFDCDTTKIPPVITIQFTLTKQSTDPLEQASQDFKTTVSLRTY